MLQHYKNTSGYAALYLMIVFAVSLISLLLAGLAGALGIQSGGKIAAGVILAAFWIVGFIVMRRFLAIEKRRPTFSEANLIGVKSVLYVLAFLFCAAICIAIIAFILNLISSLGGSETAGGPPQTRGGGGNQSQQSVGALLGAFGGMLLLYAAPFLNLALLSRLFQPSGKVVQ